MNIGKLKIFGVVLILAAIPLLSGCVEEEVIVGNDSLRGTLSKLIKKDGIEYNYLDITLTTNESISKFRVYRYYSRSKSEYDWHDHLKPLKGKDITISYAQKSTENAAHIITVECHNCTT